jgi:hypothetical protein
MKRRIFRASAEQSVEPLVEIEALLESLRSAWCQLRDQSQAGSGQSLDHPPPNPGIMNAKTHSAEPVKQFNISV